MLNKNRFNLLLDAAIFVAFVVTSFSGLLMKFALHGGPGGGSTTWMGLTRQTWTDIHIWVGLIMVVGVVYHLVVHWSWIACVARRFLTKATGQSRVKLSVDVVMFLVFLVVSISGLVPWLSKAGGSGPQGEGNLNSSVAVSQSDNTAVNNPGLRSRVARPEGGNASLFSGHGLSEVHFITGLAMLALALLHLALHWKWLVQCTKHFIPASGAKGACPLPSESPTCPGPQAELP